MAELTPTERAAEFGLARRHLAEIYRLKVCGACKHGIVGWGLSVCSTQNRTYPHCMNTPGNRFELDRTRLQGA
jgi:hypothetical protein